MTTVESIRSAAPDRATTRARIAVSALFFTNGALFANILPRYPEIKTALELDNVGYGLAIAAFPAGAIAAGLLSAVLIRRFGSARIAVFGTIATALGLLAAALSPTGILFAVALLCGGAFDAITDVAQNAHGLRVQRRYGRSIINTFHAIWSIGAVVGGGMAAAAIALQLPLGVHLGISTAVFAAVALTALRFCLPGRDEEADARAVAEPAEVASSVRRGVSPRIVLMVIALTLIAMAGAIAEDAGNSWATLYLSESLGAAAAIAPLGFIALVGAQFIGRMLGDGHDRSLRTASRGHRRRPDRGGRNDPRADLPQRPRHDRGLRGHRLRDRDPHPRRHARRRRAAGAAPGGRSDGRVVVAAAGLPALPAGRRIHRRRPEPAGRADRRAGGGPGRGAARRGAGGAHAEVVPDVRDPGC